MPLEPIAITGIGCRYPGAESPHAFWQLLRDGIDAIEEVPPSRWEVDRFYDSDRSQPNKTNTRWGGFLPQIDRFDPQFFGIAPREAYSMDPQQRLLLEVAWEALEDAGQIPEQLRGSQTGVFIGIGTHDYSIMLWQDPVNDPYATTGTGNCIAANRISYVFDFKGPSLAIDTACSSSLVAVHLACQSLWCGESTLALAGGVNVLLLPTVTIGFSKGGFMSSAGRCKSFDASADGYVRSEGAGVVVLKPVSQALRDGDPIYAVIRGSAVNQDGFSNGMAAPNPIAQVAVLREAYRKAGVSPGQVQYVEAHGTGTKLGDPIELKALGAVLSDGRAPNCPCAIGSVKTNIGHTETAAGVAGLIKVALSLKQGQIPPSLHFNTPNPQVDFATLPLRVQTKLAPWTPQSKPALAGVNSFGFGGTNAHVVVEAAPVRQRKREQGTGNRHRGWHLLTLSAKNEAALREMAQRYVQFLQAHPETTIDDLCFTANTKRSRFQHRLAVVTESVEQLQQQLSAFATGVEAASVFHHVTTDGAPRLVFLFTGQGSQYVDMGRQLYETEPVFRQALDRCDAILQSELDRSLLSVLYPDLNLVNKKPKKKEKKQNSKKNHFITDSATTLNQTIYTQPALFAIEYALVELWRSWGIIPAAVMGHSVGEYVAACVAGVFSLKDGLKLIAARGRLMQALPQNGAMLSVLADETTVRSHLVNHSTVSIAALNGLHSTVISGHQEAITAIEHTLQTQGIKTTRLNVSHAFHSPLMEPILAEFAKVAAKVKYDVPKLPIVSNVTGQFITGDVATPDYWCQHIRQPVQFSRGMNTLHQQNYQVFLEIGASPTLLGLARGCLPQPEKIWLPSLRPGQSDEQTLLQSLGILYGNGAPIDWTQLTNNTNTTQQILPIPTYPFQRQRYWWDEAILPGMRNRSQSNNELTSFHPLLGERLLLAGSSELRFQVQVSAQHPTYLRDHCVLGQPVFPAAAYVEMALAAGQQVMKTEQLTIERLTIEQPLLLHSSTFTTIQILLAPEGTRYLFKIFSFDADLNQADTATCHATGTIATHEKPSKSAMHFAELRTSFSNSAVDRDSYYQQLRNQGLHYGEKFQGIIQLWHKAGQAFSQIQLPDTRTDTDCYYLHPTVLDACFQTIAAILPPLDRGTYLPTSIDRLQVYRPAGKSAWSHVTLEPATNGSYAGSLKANLQLFNELGAIVAEIEGLTLQFVAFASLHQLVSSNPLWPSVTTEQWFYQIEWQPRPLPDQQTNQNRDGFRTPQHWLIFADRQGVGTTLADQLQAQGDRCVLVFAKSSASASLPQRVAQSLTIDPIVIDPTKAIEFQQLFTNLSNLSATTADAYGVIHLWSLDSESCETSHEDGLLALQTAQELGCGSILHLIQAWGQTKSVRLSRLWLITQETQSVTAEPLMVTTPRQSIQQASIWGLGRVIQLEHPELNCVCVDIDASYNQHPGSSLVALILQEIYHNYSKKVISTNQIAYRNRVRYVAQLVPFDRNYPPGNALQIPDAPAFRLGTSNDGVLDNLALISTDRRSPQPGEIEIQISAAGVNFRDVLNALGMLKPHLEQVGVVNANEIPFGGECAGRVVAVGAGVTDFQIGDEIIAAPAIGSLGQFVTVDARFVARKPRALSPVAAATIPTTFLTAYYGLCRLAKLQRGDRVLIHAAAGGVGQAAVQLAKSVGAEIYATASPSKWEFLRSIGITHLFNSRDLEFADQILRLTQGRGVDVVLNSLNGDFIAQSLAILAPKGRFVEIGKIGIWSTEQVRQARSDVAYFPFDLLEVARQTPAMIADLLQALMPLFDQGSLHPLPHTVFPIESAPAAFRYMAQAKHIGKVVLTVPPPASAWIVQSESSYLITGGLGALGLQVAQWLVRQGATHLILASRRSPSASAMQTIQQLEQSGANIVIAQADISQREEVDRLLSSTVPIRGIIHAAGVLDDGVLQQLSWQRFQQVLAPKVTGTWNLHQASQNLPLDFFVCFSSIASLLGSPGQGSYAAANAFMDALMHHRRQIGLPGLSINWGPWAKSGMAAELTDRYQSRLSSQGLKQIDPQQGLQVLETLLRQRHTQVGVLPVDWAIFLEANPMASSTFLSALASTTRIASTASTTQPRSELLQQLERMGPSDRLLLLQDHLRMQLSKVLGFSSPDLIDPQENFADLGMDSLMAVEFNNRLQTSLNYTIPQTLTFDYPTVELLANHLLKTILEIPITIAGSNLSPSSSSTDIYKINRLNQDQSNQSKHIESKSDRSANSTQSALPLLLHSAQLSYIPEGYYQFDKSIEYQNLQKDLDRLKELGNPFFVVQQGTARDTTCVNDQTLINYSSYNYLGMSGDPIVIQAVKAAIDRYGTSVSASRVVSGERPIHRELEQEIASFLGTEDCIAYVGGHSTNVTTIGHLLGERDLILCDALSHNSIREGCALSGAAVMNFPHNDWQSLEQILSQHRHHYEKTLIAIEGLYSTDGDIAPLPEIVSLKHHYKSLLLVDEAHSIGVLGNRGRGVAEHFQMDSTQVDLWMGTLSKSFASCGGYIAASQAIVTYLKYTAPGFVFSVGMSPANAAAALASIRLLKQEPERVKQLHDRANLFLTLAKQHNLNTGASHNSPIIPVIVGEPHKAVQLSHRLQAQGIHVQPMVYPSVPYHAARLRFFVSCLHSEEQIHETIDRVADAIHWVERIGNTSEQHI
ncbi:type I polyketide synthase [Thermocoleostomius sinensis]|uniref:Aminotransferase class I/II-fold pyridoxal phosphate-dependent enzyme n=1 Tax=Thermocoleostomius sinensis A174 TaxID=2016057 RepID=A0A9E8ZDM8_9CYAN|nr:type I polyketide synthase [Thermocoleostomius sinensis]WAL61389.1 aminotransferase class I/II-fold pyridoxal phosphate-dependent enzyme [Thermocoleostomius sinensis A174]